MMRFFSVKKCASEIPSLSIKRSLELGLFIHIENVIERIEPEAACEHVTDIYDMWHEKAHSIQCFSSLIQSVLWSDTSKQKRAANTHTHTHTRAHARARTHTDTHTQIHRERYRGELPWGDRSQAVRTSQHASNPQSLFEMQGQGQGLQ